MSTPFCFNSGYTVVAMTLERLVVVYKPLHARTICTRRHAYIIITLICLLGSGVYLHYFWTYGQIEEVGPSRVITVKHCTILAENRYLKYYIEKIRPYQDLVIRSALPFTCLLMCNILIIVKVSKQYRKRGQLTGSSVELQRKQNKMTVMLLSISFMHLICITPMQIMYLIDKSDPFGKTVTSKRDAIIALRWAFAIDIYFFNSCINYILFCLQGEEYRRVLRLMLSRVCCAISCWRRRESCGDHSQPNSQHSTVRGSVKAIA